MKTYKGYNKLPYCNTHYPTTKFTAVADTPENMRLRKNTQNQSSVIYHKDFEDSKSKYTVVSDDPETLRLKKNTQQTSDIAYQGKRPSVSAGPPQPASTGYNMPAEPQPPRQQQQHQDSVFVAQEAPAPVALPPQAAPPPPAQSTTTYVALYDYTAADTDEVTFVEGDIIVDGEEIDAGWMTGTVKRTGENGMLPSNYVELQ